MAWLGHGGVGPGREVGVEPFASGPELIAQLAQVAAVEARQVLRALHRLTVGGAAGPGGEGCPFGSQLRHGVPGQPFPVNFLESTATLNKVQSLSLIHI